MSKRTNEYVDSMGKFYTDTPKAVFAAIALSYANWAVGNEAANLEDARRRLVHEWQALHDNSIVPQAPPKEVKK